MGYLQQVLAMMNSSNMSGTALPRSKREALWDNLSGRMSDAAAGNKEWANFEPGKGVGGTSIGDVAYGGLNVIGRGMDVLSRGLYGNVAGMRKGIQEGVGPASFLSLATMIPAIATGKADDIARAEWEGLSGRDKSTTSDLLKDLGVENGFVRGAAGFAGDVVLDPISFIPIGGVAATAGRGVAKKGFEAAGRELPKVLEKGGIKGAFRTKNAVDKAGEQTKSALTPEDAALQSLDETGAAKVHTDVSDRVIDKVNAEPATSRTTYPFDIAEGPYPEGTLSNIQRITGTRPALERQLPTSAKGVKTGQYVGSAETNLAALRTQAEDLLKPFESSRYTPDVEIKPFQLETSKTKQVTKPVEKTREVPATAAANPQTAIKETIEKTIHGQTYVNKAFKVFNAAGKPFAKDLESGAAATVNRVKAQGITPKDLFDIASGAKEMPAHWKDAHIRTQSGNLMSVPKFITMAKSKARTAGALAGKTKKEKYIENELVDETVTSTRRIRTNAEVAAWAASHQHLDPEDIVKLSKAGKKSYAEFEKALEEVKSSKVSNQYKSLDELEQALADGTAPPEVVAAVKERLGPKAKIGTLKKKLSEAETTVAERRARHEEETTRSIQKDLEESRADFKKHFGMPNVEGHPELMRNVADKIDREINGAAVPKTEARETLQQWQADILKSELNDSNIRQFQLTDDYKHKTGQGADTVSPTPYGSPKGKPVRWKNGFNARSQMELVRNIIAKTGKQLEDTGIKDADRANVMYDTVMPMLHAADQIMKENGITRILGTGEHGQGIPMSMFDILSSVDRDFAKKFFFDKIVTPPGKDFKVSNNMLPTQVMDIAEQMIHVGLGNITRDEAKASIRELLQKPGGTSNIEGYLTERLGRGNKKMTAEQRLDAATDEVMAGFETALPKIMDRLEDNIKHSVMAETHIAAKISDEAIAKYDAVINDPSFSPGRHIQAAVDSHKYVDEAAHLNNINEYHRGVQLAHQAMDAHVASTIPVRAVKTVEATTNDVARAVSKNDVVKAQQRISKDSVEEAQMMIERDGGNKYDLGRLAEMSTTMSFLRRFIPDMGNEEIHSFMLNWNSAAQTYVKDHAQVLAKIHATYSPDQIKRAWRDLQGWEEGMPMTPEMQEMNIAIKDMIDVTNGKFGFFNRNVKDPSILMEDYARMGVPDHIALDPNDLENSWRAWESDDPLDLISRVTAAHTHAVSKQTMGADLSHRFGYDHPAPGRVKIVASGHARQSELIKHINTDLWYDEDVARQFHMLDTTLEALAKGTSSSSPTARNLLKNLDIATQMWKAGVTIYRPGHHVRNAIGDIWLASMDGVTPGYYKRALSVMKGRGDQYNDFDALRASASVGGPDALPKNVLTLKFRGETRAFTGDDLYRMMHDAGALPSYDVIEDVSLKQHNALDLKRATGVLGKIQNVRVPGAQKAHKFATGVSEGRDHYIRIAHFIHAMENAPLKGGSFDEAIRHAALESTTRVRKWHPDGSDLTQFERKYMRRLIPFYSWVRKAIPLVIETGIQHPGKSMIYPKAMYNWAEAQGIDLQGYGNPFPTNQIFPSWISDSIQGPTFGAVDAYGGIKPGIPNMDIADDYLANPSQTWKTIIGSTHPALRVPIEMMSHTKLRTGGPITDMSDYVDAQVPMGTYIDALAGGRSLSTGFTQQNYTAPSNQDYESGALPGNRSTSFLNWLTGLGLTDFSKPSYEKFAQLEQKRGG